MKKQILGAVFPILLCVVLIAGLILLMTREEQPEETKPTTKQVVASVPTASSKTTEPTVPTTLPTEPPTEPTPPPTEPTEPPTVPTKPSPGWYFVPEEYPTIETLSCVDKPPVLPIPADDAAEQEWIAFFYGLLRTYDSWYNKVLFSEFESPEHINLNHLFYNGTFTNHGKLTDAEITFLEGYNWEFGMDTFRSPASDIRSILQIYFGTTMEACIQNEPYTATYFDQTDCYYNSTGGSNFSEIYGIVGYVKLENGDYGVQYVSFGEAVYEVVLHRVGDYFQIVSNLKIQ